MSMVSVTVWVSTNCDPLRDDEQQFLHIVFNGHPYSDKIMPTTSSRDRCYCSNCAQPITFNFAASELQYNTGGNNTISFSVSYDEYYENGEYNATRRRRDPQRNETICFNFMTVNVTYTFNEPIPLSISPSCGPVGGGTNVTITGANFNNGRDMHCVIDSSTKSNLTVISDTIAYCETPSYIQTKVSFTVETKITDDIYITTGDLEFTFYNDPILESVSPVSGSTKGDTLLTIYGSFDFTDSGRCRFTSRWQNITVGAKSSGDRSSLLCLTPQWGRNEEVNLSVSLNGQQYSRSLVFKFQDSFQLSTMHYFLIGLGSVLFVLLVVFIIVWIKHRSTLDGYERIRDGNVFVAMKDIKFGERIGRGTFGEVFKCTWRGAVVAVKKLTTTTVSEEFIQEFEKEVSLMRNLRAPNVLQFLGSSFQPPNNVCIVIEYMQRGSLYGILHNYTNVLDWSLILRMLADTARGMTYLHTCKPPVIHRDLKSHNLLVDEFWRVKVCDFGLSTVLEHSSQTMTACGTPCWTAPEVLKHLHYTVKADVYSFAIVMWECISRVDPYLNIPPFKVIYAVAREKMRPKVPQGIPQEYVRLMKDCWAQNPDSRPQFETILDRIEVMCAQNWHGQPVSHLPLTENAETARLMQPPQDERRPSAVTTTTTTGVMAAATPDVGGAGVSPSPIAALAALSPTVPSPTVPTETTPLTAVSGSINKEEEK